MDLTSDCDERVGVKYGAHVADLTGRSEEAISDLLKQWLRSPPARSSVSLLLSLSSLVVVEVLKVRRQWTRNCGGSRWEGEVLRYSRGSSA